MIGRDCWWDGELNVLLRSLASGILVEVEKLQFVLCLLH